MRAPGADQVRLRTASTPSHAQLLLERLIEAVRDQVRTVDLKQVIDDARFVPATEIPNPEAIQIIQPGVPRSFPCRQTGGKLELPKYLLTLLRP